MKISKVLYINLDYRQDRLKSVQEVLEKCPHPTERISAIRPSDEDVKSYNVICQDFISKNGIIGCTLSHKKCIEYLISQALPDDEYSIILEDDVQIHQSFWSLLEIINVGEDADIIFFDTSRKDSYYGLHYLYQSTYPLIYKIHDENSCKSKEHAEFHNNKSFSCFHGTHCIAYKNSKLQKMLNWFNNIELYRSIDLHLIFEKQLIRYFVETGLVYQDIKNLNSNINNRLNKNNF